ncbi:unnamed protein product [Protopolystoma xenopodis]|uniref:Uncharacterized protein n=1 Tax=Protopolystoma xenopodis TaxID=117903 RepID=A0A3S5B2S3_9PLAT|nr:unnamed protein product [Protopolystoma xenopodis]
MGHRDSYSSYSDNLIAFTQHYELIQERSTNLVACSNTLSSYVGVDNSTDLVETMSTLDSCAFNINWGYLCNKMRYFGYEMGTPCIILKINLIFGWQPSLYSSVGGVEVCCHGRTEFDQQLMGEVCYYDGAVSTDLGCSRKCGVFPHFYFPYLRQETYLSPLVFMEFRNLSRYVAVQITCHLKAVNANSKVNFVILME